MTMYTHLIGQIIFLAVCFLVVDSSFANSQQHKRSEEKRCGWLDNPTPGNIWLLDKDGEWIIGIQGSRDVPDGWEMPAFNPSQWVHTNGGNYGYGCVCMHLELDLESKEVLRIDKTAVLPLSRCRTDRTLNQWKDRMAVDE